MLRYNTQGAVRDANKVSMWTMSYRSHCDDGTGYNLNLLQGELMTLGPGKLCHCCVHVDCRSPGSQIDLILSFPLFYLKQSDSGYFKHQIIPMIVFLKMVNKQQEASVMFAIVDMIKLTL